MKLHLIPSACILFSLGCVSTPKTPPAASAPAPIAVETRPDVERVDVNALQTHLNLDRAYDVLGYTEKGFNTCDAGYGYSRSQNCRQHTFVVLQVRLLCRDTEGTISTILTDQDVQPIARKSIQWALRNQRGSFLTDNEGYGQIRFIAPGSFRRDRLKITSGNEFLYMRANEITKVITPRPWCH